MTRADKLALFVLTVFHVGIAFAMIYHAKVHP